MSTLSKWADEAPGVMRRLLTDAELHAQVLAAIDDVVGRPAASTMPSVSPAARTSPSAVRTSTRT